MKKEVIDYINQKLEQKNSSLCNKVDTIMAAFQIGSIKYGMDSSDMYWDDGYCIQKNVDGNLCSFGIYTDIESGQFVEIDNNHIDEFEASHYVFDGNIPFTLIRQSLIVGIIEIGEKEAVKEMIKKYGKRK